MDEITKKEWYEDVSLEDAKIYIKTNMVSAARSFIAVGYYLKEIRDRELYLEDDYTSIWDFAACEYGLSKSTASRYMAMNDRFSQDGNSPLIREEYKEFGKSQLQEMLYLSDEQLEQVSPETMVKQIREIRRETPTPYTGAQVDGQIEINAFPEYLPEGWNSGLEAAEIQSGSLGKITAEISIEEMIGAEPEEVEAVAISQQESKIDFKTLDYLIASAKSVSATKESNEIEQKEVKVFNTIPTGCIHRDGYGCTLTDENKTVPGDGELCNCCWYCKYHGMCHFECNASAGRAGERPVFDAAWFVKKWSEIQPGDFQRAVSACNTDGSMSVKAKAIQETISPYGAYCIGCSEWDFAFHGFAGGIDFKIGKESLHLKYGRLANEILELLQEEPSIEEPGGAVIAKEEEPQELTLVEDEDEEVLYFTVGNHVAYGATCAALTKAYLDELHSRGLEPISAGETAISVMALGHECVVEPGYDAEFWKADRLWFKVEWQRLQYNFEYFYPDRTPVTEAEATTPQEAIKEDAELVPEETEVVIDAAFTEVPDAEEYTLEYFLKEQNKELEDMLKVDMPRKPLERKKMIVCALAAMKADLEIEEFKRTYKPEQPELPLLKNNDQRAAFVDAYETWPLWIETKETGERYYRYDLPDDTSMVVKVYHAMLFDYKSYETKYEDRFTEGYGKAEYYLLQEGKFFRDCDANRSALIEKLKEIQKEPRDEKV